MSIEKLVEPSDQIPRGFLTEIWTAKDGLPRLSTAQRWKYFLGQGFANFCALPLTSTLAAGTVAVSVFLFLGANILFSNIERILVGAGNTLTLSAFLRPETTEEAGKKLVEELGRHPSVKSATYLSKRDALISFRQTLGSRASLLNGLESENPLPASIELTILPGQNAHQEALALVQLLRKHVLVEEVVHGSEWLERAERYVDAFRLIALVLSALVLAVVSFLIGSTTKLIMYARRTEIEIMQLVGATDNFVRTPFLIGSGLQGFFGAICGVLLAYLAYLGMRAYVGGLDIFGPLAPQVFFSSASLVLVVLLGAVGFAILSSMLSLRRLLDV